jgi:hypothetical protein
MNWSGAEKICFGLMELLRDEVLVRVIDDTASSRPVFCRDSVKPVSTLIELEVVADCSGIPGLLGVGGLKGVWSFRTASLGDSGVVGIDWLEDRWLSISAEDFLTSNQIPPEGDLAHPRPSRALLGAFASLSFEEYRPTSKEARWEMGEEARGDC